MLDVNEIKKDLYKSKNMAKFSFYKAGFLYYTVELSDGVYEFPIPTLQTKHEQVADGIKFTLELSEDLGETQFESEIRGSELIRWITKAINDFSGCNFKKLV